MSLLKTFQLPKSIAVSVVLDWGYSVSQVRTVLADIAIFSETVDMEVWVEREIEGCKFPSLRFNSIREVIQPAEDWSTAFRFLSH